MKRLIPESVKNKSIGYFCFSRFQELIGKRSFEALSAEDVTNQITMAAFMNG